MKQLIKLVKRRGRRSLFATGKYRKQYLKDMIVRADKGTMGIFCFETEEDAIHFKDKLDITNSWKLVRVKPIGKKKIVNVISEWITKRDLDSFYVYWIHDSHCPYVVPPPKGTVCYPAVKVLE